MFSYREQNHGNWSCIFICSFSWLSHFWCCLHLNLASMIFLLLCMLTGLCSFRTHSSVEFWSHCWGRISVPHRLSLYFFQLWNEDLYRMLCWEFSSEREDTADPSSTPTICPGCRRCWKGRGHQKGGTLSIQQKGALELLFWLDTWSAFGMIFWHLRARKLQMSILKPWWKDWNYRNSFFS